MKKDGTFRVVIDYRLLNSDTEDQSYEMKEPQEIIDTATRYNFYSLIDFTSGYHQLPMAKDYKEITAFNVLGPQGGQYQFKVMPFRLKGAPATF